MDLGYYNQILYHKRRGIFPPLNDFSAFFLLNIGYLSSILRVDTVLYLPAPRQTMNPTRSGGTIMMDKIKSVFNSEKGMAAVNLLFLLSLLIRNSGIIFIACTAWIAYLVYSIRNTSSIAVKIANGIFIALAIFMIAVNLYFMLDYYGAFSR